MNSYVRAINAVKAQEFHDLKEVKDQWRTSDAMFHGIELMLPNNGKFVLDLFTDGQNSKCPDYYTAAENALAQNWAEDLEFLTPAGINGYAFGNPPYSNITLDDEGGDVITGMKPIMEKAFEQREAGARFALLIKAATSETWWPDNLPDMTIFVKGRVAYERPLWFNPKAKTPKHSAFFGCAVLVFDKTMDRVPAPVYVTKKDLITKGKPIAAAMAKQRQSHIESFEL